MNAYYRFPGDMPQGGTWALDTLRDRTLHWSGASDPKPWSILLGPVAPMFVEARESPLKPDMC